MKVSIEYCNMWDYMPNAASLAEELKKSFGVESEFIAGKNGIFDVKVDGKLVFSKHEAGRFPNKGEVSALMAKAQS